MYSQATRELRTIRDVLRFAMSRFGASPLIFGHGSQDPWDEAVYLVLHTLHLPLDRLDPFLDARLTKDELASVIEVLKRRIEDRIPAAYLTGEAWLGPYRFQIDSRAIIPRSFIAELLDDQFSPWVEDPMKITRVLDLCTGSGCLAIIAALTFPNAKIDAVDLSTDALEVAAGNVATYGLNDQIQLIHSDLFDRLGRARYDLILSNPPYVNDASMDALPPEYRAEPDMALRGGADGLDLVRRLLARAPDYLKRSRSPALVIVEVGHEKDHVDIAFPDLPMTWLTTSAGDDMVFLVHGKDLVSLDGSGAQVS